MKRIILDTNFLLIPGKFGIDVFSEIDRIMDYPYELCIIGKTLEELERIEGKDKKFARMAQDILKTKGLKILEYPSKKDVDSLIVEALDKDTLVATDDKALTKEIRGRGCQVIYTKQKKYLEMM